MKTLISSPTLNSSDYVIKFDVDTAKLLFFDYGNELLYAELESIEEIECFDYDGHFGPYLFYTLAVKNIKTKTHSMIRDRIHSVVYEAHKAKKQRKFELGIES